MFFSSSQMKMIKQLQDTKRGQLPERSTTKSQPVAFGHFMLWITDDFIDFLTLVSQSMVNFLVVDLFFLASNGTAHFKNCKHLF
jgi:hypothetical protein